MSGWKRNLALVGMGLSVGLALLGIWGLVGKNVRAVDVLAIFAGGFMTGITLLKFLQMPRATVSASTPPPAPPGSPSPPVSKSGA